MRSQSAAFVHFDLIDAGINVVRPSTGALCAPAQDEAIFFVPSKFHLILSLRPQGACRRTHDTNAAPVGERSSIYSPPRKRGSMVVDSRFRACEGSARKGAFADIVQLRNGPPLSRGRRILEQNQIIPSFPRKRESIRCQSVTFVRLDCFTRSFAGMTTEETSDLTGTDHALSEAATAFTCSAARTEVASAKSRADENVRSRTSAVRDCRRSPST
jgi:hypothetical protein